MPEDGVIGETVRDSEGEVVLYPTEGRVCLLTAMLEYTVVG